MIVCVVSVNPYLYKEYAYKKHEAKNLTIWASQKQEIEIRCRNILRYFHTVVWRNFKICRFGYKIHLGWIQENQWMWGLKVYINVFALGTL